MEQFNQKAVPLNDKLRVIGKDLRKNLMESVRLMKQLSEKCSQYAKLHSTFNNRVFFGKNNESEQIYTSLETLFSSWAARTTEKTSTFFTEYERAIKYNKYEARAVNEVFLS